MFVLLKRIVYRDTYTIGNLFIDGVFFCDTLEPPKTAKHPCIPSGAYVLDFRWSPKFGKYMIGVTGVPSRTGILFHSGNSSKDTLGCVLLGHNTFVGRLTNSRIAYSAFRKKVSESMISSNKPIILNVV